MANLSALKRFKLDEVFWFQEGPGVRKWQFTDSGIKLLNVANIEKNRTINLGKTDRHLDFKEVEDRYSHFLLDAGDLVIASSGISFDDDGMLRTRGAFVEERHLPLCLNTSTIRFKSKPEISDLGYLQHWLDSREFREQITKRVTGSAQQNFGPSHLKEIKITLPPLPEQRRIAAILDQADALRAKRREALAQLDSLTQSIFVEMFGHTTNNSKGWKCCAVSEVTDCIVPGRDKPKSFTGETPWVTTDDLAHLDFTYRSTKGYGLSPSEISGVKARVIPANSVIISCVGNLGITTIAAEKMVINQQLHSYQCHEQVNNIYLMFCLAKQTAFMYAKASSTTLPYMNKSVCNSIPVQIPPIELQREFATRALAINEIKEQHLIFLAELDTLFASLQHRTFRGEL